jgi:hypothetical protein
MSTNRSTLLGVALTPTSADLSEVRRDGKGVKVLRRSTLVFAPDAGLDQPANLGAALAEHLESNGYTTRHAVIGLCPRWVLTRLKQVPPADRDAIRGIVNLQIERDFAGSASDMTFDYLLGEVAGGSTDAPLVLAGVRQTVLDQARQAAQAAGLRTETITPTAFAAASKHSGTVIQIEDGVAGVLRVRDGMVEALASCQADANALHDPTARGRLLSDLSRCVMQLPGGAASGDVTVILPTSIADADARQFVAEAEDRFGRVNAVHADAASMLAEHATTSGTALIRFNDSKLAPPKGRRISSRVKWALRAAVVVLLIVGTGLYLWTDATSRRDALQAELDAISQTAEDLGTIQSDTVQVASWYDKRPPALECMLELTRTFPKQGEIRVETLTLRGEMLGQIDCAASDRETMDTYFTQMQRSDSLLKINRGPVRPSGGNSTWIDFSVAFRFDAKAKGATP